MRQFCLAFAAALVCFATPSSAQLNPNLYPVVPQTIPHGGTFQPPPYQPPAYQPPPPPTYYGNGVQVHPHGGGAGGLCFGAACGTQGDNQPSNVHPHGGGAGGLCFGPACGL